MPHLRQRSRRPAEQFALTARAELDPAPRSGTPRPGWITVTYDIALGEQRIIRFPTYRDAGHTVSVSTPGERYADVLDFLQETLP